MRIASLELKNIKLTIYKENNISFDLNRFSIEPYAYVFRSVSVVVDHSFVSKGIDIFKRFNNKKIVSCLS